METTKTQVRKLFRVREEMHQTQTQVHAPGWILLVDATEGWFYVSNAPGASHHRGFEEGRLLLLTPEGALKQAKYTQESYRGYGVSGGLGSWSRHTLRDVMNCSSEDLINFDRLNRSYYREVRKRQDENYRSEMGRNWQIRVPHPGMEASLALKRFKETCRFVSTFSEPG
jgi:hypothetical protein